MSGSRAKAKGTAWETLVVRWLQANGWPSVERRALHGSVDKGDIAGLPVVIECKAHRTYNFGEWVAEAEVEAGNAGVSVGVVWAKRVGKTSPADGYVVMSGATWLQVLEALR